MRRLIIIGVVMIFFSGCNSQLRNDRLAKLETVRDWWCYYGSDKAVFDSGKDLYVLESANIGEINHESDNHPLSLAYLSVGELDITREESKNILNEDFIIEPNGVWSDARLVDVRSKKWQKFVLKCAKERLALGYDGLFLDTIDSVETLLNKDPELYDGITKALVALVKKLRKANPHAIIIANGGAGFASELSPYIDAWCMESVENTYDFKNKKYTTHEIESQQWVDKRLRELKETNLPIFVLDYSDLSSEKNKLLTSLRTRGLIPAISTIDLQKLP